MQLNEGILRSADVLVVDDDPASVQLLEHALHRNGFQNVRGMTEGAKVLHAVGLQEPDVILLDLHMPGIDGVRLITELRSYLGEEDLLPIVVLTGDTTAEARSEALAAGATDFLTKPFDIEEVVLRTYNCLTMRRLHLRLVSHGEDLEERVRERTRELQELADESLRHLSNLSEFRDDETHEHTIRVGAMAGLLADAVGLDEATVGIIRLTAPLHDLGKVGIPDAILLKPGKLTEDEMQIMREHSAIGGAILGESMIETFRVAAEIARTHHERWDGTGYPGRLSGASIPLTGRIVAPADVFDALTHERPYKRAWPVEQAIDEIRKGRGTQFDPELTDLFLERVVPVVIG